MFAIDEEKIEEEARYDGKWVLQTNLALPAATVALKYKQLWMVEDVFRTMKTVLETRPIYHKCDETSRGHVWCSFLALVLRVELQRRLAALTPDEAAPEWADVVRDLEALAQMEIEGCGRDVVFDRSVQTITLTVAQFSSLPEMTWTIENLR